MPVEEKDDIKLPPSVFHEGKEYKRRVLEADRLAVIEYSIEAVMMRHLLRPDVISKKRVKDNLLVESVKPTLEEAIEDMKKKIKPYLGE
jgi:hypothetical protein